YMLACRSLSPSTRRTTPYTRPLHDALPISIRKRDARVQPAILRVLHPRCIRYLLAIKLPEDTHIRRLQIEVLRLRKCRVVSKSIEKLTFQRHRVGKI